MSIACLICNLSRLNLSAGSYSLHVGLYHPFTGEGLLVPG